jgi:hypothetical protein
LEVSLQKGVKKERGEVALLDLQNKLCNGIEAAFWLKISLAFRIHNPNKLHIN